MFMDLSAGIRDEILVTRNLGHYLLAPNPSLLYRQLHDGRGFCLYSHTATPGRYPRLPIRCGTIGILLPTILQMRSDILVI